jgi:hypothetical protein
MSKPLTFAEKKKQLQWEKDNLVMSGSQLTNLLGVSMNKIINCINDGTLGFPKPAKTKWVGDYQQIKYYIRQELKEFMARVDLKTVIFRNLKKNNGRQIKMAISTTDPSLYFQFFKVNQSRLQNYGVGRYDCSDETAQGGAQ